MNPIIVYVDDATYAQPMLEALAGSSQAASSHWLLVACAPRMTHRVSKWVSHRARENWRGKWADKLFAALMPVMATTGGKVTAVLAKGKGYRLAEGCTFPLLGYYKRRQALDSRTAGNGRLARNTLEKAIFHQSRRLVAEPAAALDLILPSDLELKEP